MKTVLGIVSAITAVWLIFTLQGANQPSGSFDGPQYTTDGQLMRPANYREWIYLSSGLGMTYGPIQSQARDREPMFDNVFVSRPAYNAFIDTGKWPDKTILVLEVRSSESKGSINNGGHYQSEARAVEAHVKDEARFPGKWAFFPFHKGETASKAIPTTANCYSCHSEHGAVDTTFVQFYPTLLEVAKAKGTLTH
jgi:hypothetical protein